MGMAAFILAAMTCVPYRDVIIAATLPAVVYFLSLFLIASFQSRKKGIEAISNLTKDMGTTRTDVLHLSQVFLSILLIIGLFQFFAMTVKMLLGMGMTAVPAHINVALLMGLC